MFVVMGAAGHVGSAVVRTLVERGQKVTVVTHDDAQSGPDRARWRDQGIEVAVADVNDPASLRRAFDRGRRAFLLNPPADTTTDTEAGRPRPGQGRHGDAVGEGEAVQDDGVEQVGVGHGGPSRLRS